LGTKAGVDEISLCGFSPTRISETLRSAAMRMIGARQGRGWALRSDPVGANEIGQSALRLLGAAIVSETGAR
jgi:hypothetical protein